MPKIDRKEKDPFVTIEEVAKQFNVSTATVSKWMKSRDIPEHTYISIGQTNRFDLPAVIDALLRRKRYTDGIMLPSDFDDEVLPTHGTINLDDKEVRGGEW